MHLDLRLLGTLVAASAALLTSPLAAADGDLDPTFNGGQFTIAWSVDQVRATAVEPIADGGLLVGGPVASEPGDFDGWAVAKFFADGSRDIAWGLNYEVPSAGDETMAGTGDLYDMGRDASDRTYLVGMADAGTTYDLPMLVRLTPSGALDDSFDENGIVVARDMPDDWEELEVREGKILADGRSVFVGSCTLCPTEDEEWIWVARRLADGSPDTSFSGDGWHKFRFSNTQNQGATSVAIDASGRIVVGGYTGFVLTNTWFARLTAAGNLDGAFGGGDGLAGPYEEMNSPRALAIDPSTGRIAAVSGNSGPPSGGQVNVLTAAGVPDATFSGDGQVGLNIEEGTSLLGVAFQSDSKLLAVGSIDALGTNNGGFFLVRLKKDGGLDSTYDFNGMKRVEFDAAPDVLDRAWAVATMGGRLIAVGSAGAGGGHEEEMAVVRTENAQIFSDGFERGSTASWPGY